MIQERIDSIPLNYRFNAVYVLLALSGVAALAAAAYLGTSNVIVQTHTRVVKQTWGKPDQTISSANFDAAAAQVGLTQCDWYASKHSLVCH